MAKDDKLKALDAAIAQIERQYGKGSVMKLGDNSANMNVETVPTGSLSLDIALGLGGLPKGRIIEIYGPESSGKTTVALHCVAEVQKQGGIAGFIDAEHALDPVYAKNIGVDIDNLYISQPDCGEQALEITETMVRSGAVDIVIVDSVAALVPKAEIDGDMGDSHVGLQARLMSQALRKLTGVISKSNCIVIFINQLREKVGVMFGNPETTTGGRALKFYSSVRLDVRRVEQLKQAGEVIVPYITENSFMSEEQIGKVKAGDTISLDHDVRLKIETVKDADEKEWIGVFTSSEEMHKGSAGNVQMNQSIESILRLALNWEQVNGIVINPFGKYIQMTKKMIELLINGYEHYENERKSKDDENN